MGHPVQYKQTIAYIGIFALAFGRSEYYVFCTAHCNIIIHYKPEQTICWFIFYNYNKVHGVKKLKIRYCPNDKANIPICAFVVLCCIIV